MKLQTILAGAVGLTALAAVTVPVQRSTLTERLQEINKEIQQQAPTPTAPTATVPAAVILNLTNSWVYVGQDYTETGVKVDFAECSSNCPPIKAGTGAADAIATVWSAGIRTVLHDQYGILVMVGEVKK